MPRRAGTEVQRMVVITEGVPPYVFQCPEGQGPKSNIMQIIFISEQIQRFSAPKGRDRSPTLLCLTLS